MALSEPGRMPDRTDGQKGTMRDYGSGARTFKDEEPVYGQGPPQFVSREK